MKTIKLKVNYRDRRGKITDMIEGESINAVTKVTFNKGAIRGNHFHKKTIQYNYLLTGKIKLLTQTGKEKIKKTIVKSKSLFVIFPNEKHAFEAMENSELMVFTRGPRGGKEYESDTFRLEKPLIKKTTT